MNCQTATARRRRGTGRSISDFACAAPSEPDRREDPLNHHRSPASLPAVRDDAEHPFPPSPPASVQQEPVSRDELVREPSFDQGGVTSSSSESSSDDSSSSPGGTEDEAIQNAGEHKRQVRARVDHNGCPLFRHSRTMTVHVAPLGNQWTKFLCGRLKTKDHQPCQGSIMLAKWMCKQCSAGRPAQDISGLNEVLDRVLKRSRE